MTALADSAAARVRIYAALERRNASIGRMRIVVPIAGAFVLAVLLAQVVIGNLGRDFSIGRVSIEAGRLNVDTPSYTGVLADGGSYRVTAGDASTPIDAPGLILLESARLDLVRASGVEIVATAARASLDTADQLVTIAGRTDIVDSTGMTAEVMGLSVDSPGQTADATGPVRIEFPGGATLDAATMHYEVSKEEWTFGRATYRLPDTPRSVASSP